jgi:hypothetical protein
LSSPLDLQDFCPPIQIILRDFGVGFETFSNCL